MMVAGLYGILKKFYPNAPSEKDHAFIAIKMQELISFRMTIHPIEFDMDYTL